MIRAIAIRKKAETPVLNIPSTFLQKLEMLFRSGSGPVCNQRDNDDDGRMSESEVLCEVPQPAPLSDAELLTRIEALYGTARRDEVERQLQFWSDEVGAPGLSESASWGEVASLATRSHTARYRVSSNRTSIR